ncbi:DUF402 domain-containing protein [Nocardia bovistercoris]|uniref:DUF402 domain-containing protein n=1 Tax=Nocardia bovistercoris TaxID=2785916 RepID=A0A931IH23_9NOCA|nr:DUF402 domain-containing protein [Nocardia bovistercoris]MBH0780256.1 DUF402 domain-containing protein [Nocardia bovistercoris]
MSALVPLLVAAPTMTGIAGYMARDIRRNSDSHPPGEQAPPGPPVRRPAVEYFDLADLTGTDTRGYVRPVDRCRRAPWGLYVARADGAGRRHSETWLLPELGIRVTRAHRRPARFGKHDYRLDIGEFGEISPKRWRAVDLYLDIVARQGRPAELHGADELLAAHAAGLVDAERARRALDRATSVVDGCASHSHDLEEWLAAEGIVLTWM